MDTGTGKIYSQDEVSGLIKKLENSIESDPIKAEKLKAELDRIVPVSETVAEKMRLGNKAYKKKQKRQRMADLSRRKNR
jgi:hypothetical protein